MIKEGYYWAAVDYPFSGERRIEIVEYVWRNEDTWEDGAKKELDWVRCGSDIPIWPLSRIKLFPHNGPMKMPESLDNLIEVKQGVQIPSYLDDDA
jgi:hypothetical protein